MSDNKQRLCAVQSGETAYAGEGGSAIFEERYAVNQRRAARLV
jgi:hypothetical protein